jgi:hypothetical protein
MEQYDTIEKLKILARVANGLVLVPCALDWIQRWSEVFDGEPAICGALMCQLERAARGFKLFKTSQV